jgi:hypothetical protein
LILKGLSIYLRRAKDMSKTKVNNNVNVEKVNSVNVKKTIEITAKETAKAIIQELKVQNMIKKEMSY